MQESSEPGDISAAEPAGDAMRGDSAAGDPLDGDPVAGASKPWNLLYIFALVFIQGLVVNHITVLLPVLKDVLELDPRALGRTASFAFAGGLPALFISGYVTEWLRPKRSGVIAIGLLGLAGIGESDVGVDRPKEGSQRRETEEESGWRKLTDARWGERCGRFEPAWLAR